MGIDDDAAALEPRLAGVYDALSQTRAAVHTRADETVRHELAIAALLASKDAEGIELWLRPDIQKAMEGCGFFVASLRCFVRHSWLPIAACYDIRALVWQLGDRHIRGSLVHTYLVSNPALSWAGNRQQFLGVHLLRLGTERYMVDSEHLPIKESAHPFKHWTLIPRKLQSILQEIPDNHQGQFMQQAGALLEALQQLLQREAERVLAEADGAVPLPPTTPDAGREVSF